MPQDPGSTTSERRLAAILFTDIVGSTAVTARSESAGLALRDRHRELVRTRVEAYRGRFIEAPGDESLSTFESAVDAVHAALAIQRELESDDELQVRIGIHTGETMFRRDEVFGDSVNIAARIRELAEPGKVLVSGEVARAVQNQSNVEVSPRGEHKLKGVEGSVMVHAVTGTAAEPSVTPHAAAQPIRAAGRWFTAAGAVALVAVIGLAWWLFEPRAAGPPLTAIAVLPFDDMSPGGDQTWLADGLAEDLIETLSRSEDLQVPGRNSSFSLRGQNLAAVGAELNVGSVVEGSVRRSGDALLVTAQLIRVEDGYHLWSARYDRDLDDVFAVQLEIARAIAEAIQDELGIEYDVSWLRSYEPSDPRAYELLKRVIHAMDDPARIEDAIRTYDAALAIDPGYAQAHAELGFAYLRRWEHLSRDDADFAEARLQVERALAIEPDQGAALNLLGEILMRQFEWDEARAVQERGIAANPGHGALRFGAATRLAHEGRTADALVQARRAAEIDPRVWFAHGGVGSLQMTSGQHAEAIESLKRALELAPNPMQEALTQRGLAIAYYGAGMDAEAQQAAILGYPAFAEQASDISAPDFPTLMARLHEWRVEQSGRACTEEPEEAVRVLALLGERTAMLDCLEQAIDLGPRFSLFTLFPKADPLLEPYRDDPRFIALLGRMNLAN